MIAVRNLPGKVGEKALGALYVPGALAIALMAGYLVANPRGGRLILAATVTLLLVVIGLRRPSALLVGIVPWFAALGLIRRLISGVSVKEAWGDPLVLVGVVAWGVLTLVAVRRGAFTGRTQLTNGVIALGTVLSLSAANPLQGGLAVGLSGALLVVTPIAAFFVGRALLDDRLFGHMLWLVVVCGLAAGTYGLFQTFSGFPSWDRTWLANEAYRSLTIGGVSRAFASFSAASEYAGFLTVAVAVCVARARRVLWWPLSLAVVSLLAVALWYESSRGAVVITIGTVGLVLAARAGVGMGRSLVVAMIALAFLPVVVSHLAPTRFSDSAADQFAAHQIEGLTDPFGEKSTLPAHIALVVNGVKGAVTDPIGLGVGSTTISGKKYGGTSRAAEADPGNASHAAGFPGLIAYGMVVLLGIPRAYALARERRDGLGYAALGIVLATSLQWLNGAQYAVAFWPWLALGWVDARSAPRRPAREPGPDRRVQR